MNKFQDNDDSEINNSKEKDTLSFNEISNLKRSKFHYKNNNQENMFMLYNNNFKEQRKPLNLGGTRNCLYINNYPLISIGKNISLPLLVILSLCCIYIYIFYYFFDASGPILQKIFNYSFVIYILSHALSIFLNPGIPSFEYNKKIKEGLKNKKINDLDCTECKICNLNYKLTDKISHCEKCEVCYFGYDHHCIWIGHCVAKYNYIFFLSFIIAILVFIYSCFAMVFVKLFKIFLKKI